MIRLNMHKGNLGILLGMCVLFSLNAVSAETISLGNDDVEKAPSIFKVNKVPADEDAEGSTKKPEMKADDPEKVVEPEPEEEVEIIDSFVVLKGARRYHLAECNLVTRSKGEKTTVNGAQAISGRYFACGSCGPISYKDPPKKKEPEEAKAEDGAPKAKADKAPTTAKEPSASESASSSKE